MLVVTFTNFDIVH